MLNIILVATWVKVLVIVGIIIVFFLITILNLRTKKPKDCENIDSKCQTCLMDCIHNLNKNGQDNRQ
ncbi:hypothetical protein J6Y73_05565 [bacterium]|nr:hypothetical protein [bacterium]